NIHRAIALRIDIDRRLRDLVRAELLEKLILRQRRDRLRRALLVIKHSRREARDDKYPHDPREWREIKSTRRLLVTAVFFLAVVFVKHFATKVSALNYHAVVTFAMNVF